ncbi:hypothetical protein [Gloeomargarita lithophora]|uniref:hypothetical protein n=1 Tax=Gloeomargarita lithophora TaxID=1188228 RepID=UPI00155F5D99|nr:hypothetical protein [Gloeomargarita lithophora]
MERGKITAILTGAVAILLGVLYLLITLVLDSRGLMRPAPDLDVGWLMAYFVGFLIL